MLRNQGIAIGRAVPEASGHAESVAPTGVVALPENLANPLFFSGAGVGDFHGFLFLTAAGLVPLE
jgi:hypothetical protein